MNPYDQWHERGPEQFHLTDEEKRDIMDNLRRSYKTFCEAYFQEPKAESTVQKLTVPPLINKEVTYKILRTKLFWDKFYSSFEVEDALIIE